MRPVCGRPLIDYVIARARRIQGLAALVVATTEEPSDEVLVAGMERQGIPVYRGATEDVAARLLAAALRSGADYFVRINGDSPFLDPDVVQQGLAPCDGTIEFVTNLKPRTFPYGISVEIVRTRTFQHIYPAMTSREDREHATSYFYRHWHRFNIATVMASDPSFADVRLVVDTVADVAAMSAVVAVLGDRWELANYTEVARLARAPETPHRLTQPVNIAHRCL